MAREKKREGCRDKEPGLHNQLSLIHMEPGNRRETL